MNNDSQDEKMMTQVAIMRKRQRIQANMSLQNEQLLIKTNEGEIVLDTPLSNVKKSKYQLGIWYLYTKQGLKTVSFKYDDTITDEEVDSIANQWTNALKNSGVSTSSVSLTKATKYAGWALIIIAIVKLLQLVLS